MSPSRRTNQNVPRYKTWGSYTFTCLWDLSLAAPQIFRPVPFSFYFQLTLKAISYPGFISTSNWLFPQPCLALVLKPCPTHSHRPLLWRLSVKIFPWASWGRGLLLIMSRSTAFAGLNSIGRVLRANKDQKKDFVFYSWEDSRDAWHSLGFPPLLLSSWVISFKHLSVARICCS